MAAFFAAKAVDSSHVPNELAIGGGGVRRPLQQQQEWRQH